MTEPQETFYKVTVRYREPSYEARSAPRDTPFRWTYTLAAGGEDEARRRALREFHEAARLSSVGWSREIVAIDVHPA